MLLAATVLVLASHPYCNEAMDTGVIPPLPAAGATLLQVHVMIRHGSRVQCTTDSCWDGLPTYDCSAALLEGPDAPAAAVLPQGTVLYRKEYTAGRNRLPGNCALGQLVSAGVEMQRASGRHLRAAYGALLPASPIGNESAFLLRSDDSARTIASGQALFAAMYPSGGASAVVPWHVEEETTITCESSDVCPSFGAAVQAAQRKARASPHYAKVTVPLARELSVALNRTIAPAAVERILDCVMSVNCPTVPATGGRPPAALTPDLQQRAVDETTHGLYALLNETAVAKLGAGPLLGEVLVAMEAAAKGAAAPAFVLLSGHDTGPMAPVLGALRIGGAFPRFADLISIELHRVGAADHAVRVVHDGAAVTHHIAGCPPAELCPWAAFHAAVAALVPTPAECGRADAPGWWPRPAGP